MLVKICGVRTVEAARACALAGADYAGLNFVPGVAREIPSHLVADVVEALGDVQIVGVFRDQTTTDVLRQAALARLDWVQLHGSETPQMCRNLRTSFRVIKALTVGTPPGAYAGAVDALLIDGRAPGSGTGWDYRRLRALRTGALCDVPILLAGGLAPTNVADAIGAARPDGVDVASGVELHGVQDPNLIHAFVRAARAASERQS
jgi:phosphoribosylanthranilate isomerase